MAQSETSSGGQDPAVPLAQDAELLTRLEALLGSQVVIVAQTGSTNQDLALRAQEAALHGRSLPDLSLLATDYQSAGRGRLDRTWVVADGEALTFSVLLRPTGADGRPLPTQAFGWLTMLVSCAVVHALRAEGVPAELKWPNDVLVKGRKMVGVLASLVTFEQLPPAVVVGVGVNVSAAELPVDTATSMVLEGSTVARGDLLVRILEHILPVYAQFCTDPTSLTRPGGVLRAQLEAMLGTLGQRVRAELPGAQAALTGTAVGLDERGALVVRDDDGTQHVLTAADVVHLRPTGEGQ